MSFALATIDLSSATTGSTGPIDWSVIGQQAMLGRYDASARATLTFLNESGAGLQITFNNGQRFYLPAGGWQPVSVAADCTSATYSVIYTLGNPLVSMLLVTWYAPNEPVPPAPILGNSPIGGSVTSNTSNILQGVNQALALTEKDMVGAPALVPAGVTAPQNLTLAALDGSGTAQRCIVMAATAIFMEQPVNFVQIVPEYNGEGLSGNGLVAVLGSTDNTNVTTTGSRTITSYAVPATSSGVATIRVSGYVIVNNGVSGNNITFNVNYKDQGGSSVSRSLPMYAGVAAVTIMTGAISIANAHYEGYPLTITVQQSQTVTITYNDPTNTPNDRVTGVIERLS